MKILKYDGTTAIVEVYLAPGVVSRDMLPRIVERFELMLAESDTNMFLKRVYRKRDYYALIAIESRNFKEVTAAASSVESRTKRVASQMKSSLNSAINRLG